MKRQNYQVIMCSVSNCLSKRKTNFFKFENLSLSNYKTLLSIKIPRSLYFRIIL